MRLSGQEPLAVRASRKLRNDELLSRLAGPAVLFAAIRDGLGLLTFGRRTPSPLRMITMKQLADTGVFGVVKLSMFPRKARQVFLFSNRSQRSSRSLRPRHRPTSLKRRRSLEAARTLTPPASLRRCRNRLRRRDDSTAALSLIRRESAGMQAVLHTRSLHTLPGLWGRQFR